LGLTFIKFSAHTELKGVTVFDPIILNEPVSTGVVDEGVGVEVGVDAVLQPVKTKERTSISARGKSHFFTDLNNFILLILSFFF
jgi:hypothetical protein